MSGMPQAYCGGIDLHYKQSLRGNRRRAAAAPTQHCTLSGSRNGSISDE
jgi:hypothetical protein